MAFVCHVERTFSDKTLQVALAETRPRLGIQQTAVFWTQTKKLLRVAYVHTPIHRAAALPRVEFGLGPGPPHGHHPAID